MAGNLSRMGAFRTTALAIVLAAGVLRFWALDAGLPHLRTRPDEELVLNHTLGPAQGNPDLRWAVYPNAYVYLCWAWGEVGLRLGQLLGQLPPGSYLDILRAAPDRLLLVERTLSALAGTVTVAALMAVARPAIGRGGALSAGVLLATSFLHARDSHALKPEALFALGTVGALAASVPLARAATVGRGALAGLAVGAAMAMKYPAVLLLGPVYVAAVMGTSSRGVRRLLPGPAVVAGLVAAAVFVGTSPYMVLDPSARAFLDYLFRRLFPQLFPLSPGQEAALATAPESMRHWTDGFVYHSTFSLRYGAGVLATLLLPVAVVWGFAAGPLVLRLAAVLTVVYFVVTSASPVNLARYMTPLLPVAALLEGGLLAGLARRGERLAGIAFLTLGTLALAAEPLWRTVAFDRLAARADTRNLATDWLAANVAPGSVVAVAGARIWLYGVPRLPPGIKIGPNATDADTIARSGAEYLLTHDHPLFASRIDAEAIARLAPRLELLADFDPFTPGGRDVAVFETEDAYYIPFDRFDAVVRPGPHIRIYRFR